MGLKKLHTELPFFLTKVSHWTWKCSCINHWSYFVQVVQVGPKRECLWNIAKALQESPSKILFRRKLCYLFRASRLIINTQYCRETLDDCQSNHLFLALRIYFGSPLLTFPAYSVNTITFSGLCGNWKLCNCSFPGLKDSERGVKWINLREIKR